MRILPTCSLIFFGSLFLFLINIQFPRGHNFDEFHFVPAAKELTSLRTNQNWQHPPLGKMLIGAGIQIGGDRPFGWRLMSAVFGALALVGVFLLGIVLFKNYQSALMATALTVFNHLLYVQSRIAMLDIFMFCFLIWGFVFFFLSWDPAGTVARLRKNLLWAGVFFGLAVSTKWFALIPWVFALFLVALIRMMQNWKLDYAKDSPWRRKFPEFDDWYSIKAWKGVKKRYFVYSLGFVPVLIYIVTYLPLLGLSNQQYTLWDLLKLQFSMLDWQTGAGTPHPYMSQWYEWPFLVRPIWYAFDKEGTNLEFVRGVILLGNPLTMWAGLLAVVVCFWAWVKMRSRQAFFIFSFYAIFLLAWVVIPRKVYFYYHYFCAGMFLTFALTFVFHYFERPKKGKKRWVGWSFVGLSALFFIYFFPVLAALKIPSDSFRAWMWFSTWI